MGTIIDGWGYHPEYHVSNIHQVSEMRNVEMMSNGTVRARKGYKTFNGMVHELGLINKRYLKLGVEGDFTIHLPLPGSVRAAKKHICHSNQLTKG